MEKVPHLQLVVCNIWICSYDTGNSLLFDAANSAFGNSAKLISQSDIIFALVQYQHDVIFALLLFCSESSLKNYLSKYQLCCLTCNFQTLRVNYMMFTSSVTLTSYFIVK